MLQNRLQLVLLGRLRHCVQDIVHYSSAELKVVVRLDTLLSDGLRDALAIQRNDPPVPPGLPSGYPTWGALGYAGEYQMI